METFAAPRRHSPLQTKEDLRHENLACASGFSEGCPLVWHGGVVELHWQGVLWAGQKGNGMKPAQKGESNWLMQRLLVMTSGILASTYEHAHTGLERSKN